jgi:hypothetical protein
MRTDRLYQNKVQLFVVYKRTPPPLAKTGRLTVKRTAYRVSRSPKQAGVAILTLDKVEFKPKSLRKDRVTIHWKRE